VSHCTLSRCIHAPSRDCQLANPTLRPQAPAPTFLFTSSAFSSRPSLGSACRPINTIIFCTRSDGESSEGRQSLAMSIPLSSAATPRGTASLNVPATQNTAPVIKFRCLFTHDVRRKAKRWHDGFLRYHTFNKRVMVYDTTGYFIGDLHWRQDDGIQDGDELELDKGVLIQVCEPVEQTETDLSTLYGNKKKTQESPTQAAEPSPPSFRASAPIRSSISSQQPRSLNDVLGIRKTPTSLDVSPYEERQQQKQKEDNRLSSERAAKRQKTIPAEVPPEQYPRRSVVKAPVLVDLSDSSDEKAAERPQKPSKNSESVALPKKGPISNRPALPATRSPAVDNVQRDIEKNQNSSNDAPTTAPRSFSAHSSSEAPTKTLRLSTSQPRKKLMYQALLPNQTPGTARTVPSSAQDRKAVPPQSRPQLVCALRRHQGLC
jgi:hypothetical protein